MASVKNEETKAAVKETPVTTEKVPVEKKAAASKKAVVKKETGKAEAQPVKKEVMKKEPVKKEVVKKEPVKRATVKKEAAPKAAVKKVEPKSSVYMEFGGKQVMAKDILDKAKKAFAKANKGVEIKTIDIYLKPEEHAAYYVINGIGSDDYKIVL